MAHKVEQVEGVSAEGYGRKAASIVGGYFEGADGRLNFGSVDVLLGARAGQAGAEAQLEMGNVDADACVVKIEIENRKKSGGVWLLWLGLSKYHQDANIDTVQEVLEKSGVSVCLII